MIKLKSKEHLAVMKKAGEITGQALYLAGEAVREGISTLQLDRIVREHIEKCGARPSFLGYAGFPGSACISVNEQVIHGIPSEKKILHEGDIVKIDVGAYYKGFHGDAARTFPVGKISAEAEKLIEVTRKCFYIGAAQAVIDNRIGDIGAAVQKYAEENGIPVKATTKKPYSEDENMIHISHEAGILEDPSARCPEDVYSLTLSPEKANDKETILSIVFKDGIPLSVTNENDGTVVTDPLEMILYLNKMGHDNAIGRVDMVENRFIGIKSRGVYETPGCEILWKAHHNLEGLTMDKEAMHLRDMLSPKYAELIYNGYWGAPEFNMLTALFDESQKFVTGKATVALYKGNVINAGIESNCSLYNEDLGSMDKAGGYHPIDCKGFININAIRLMASSIREAKGIDG